MNQHYDVFISYRRSDGSALARAVRDYLTKRGLRVFLDEKELIDGQYFDTQLRGRLLETPNYVLIATPDAFQFREGEDWVREEMKLAVSEFGKNPQDRAVIPFVPAGTVFPEMGLPEGLEDLPRFNRILLKGGMPDDTELLRLAKAVCRVNRRNLWNAGQRFWEKSTEEGRRFHLLHVDERIMPLYKKDKRAKAQGATLPIHVTTGESKDEAPLRDALKEQQGNLYLIGEGGIGKTTAMISIMEQHYKDQPYTDTGEVPIFIELNGAPRSAKWYQGEDGLQSTFIRREIARLFLGVNSIGKVPRDYVENIDALLAKETAAPEYLLLLDGLNEVSTDLVKGANGGSQAIRMLIVEEINYLLTECPNVRVMLTSRTDETEIDCDKHHIEKLYLTGLHPDTIQAYLKSKKFSARDIQNALADDRLVECIRIPLFLTMFAALGKTKGIASRGEILSHFFHERSNGLQSEYTQKNRLDSLKKDTVNKQQLRFILDFLLPAIGSRMEYENEFKLSAERVAEIIEPVLLGRDANGGKPEKTAHPCAVIGEYGKQVFSGYSGLPKIAASLLDVSRDVNEVAEYILTGAVEILGILYRDENAEYGFIHHHFRDYFAAVHDVNLLRIAVRAYAKRQPDLAFESLSPFIAHANRREKTVFIGEILGEHHNKPVLKGRDWQYNVPIGEEDRSLIKRALAILRGRFGEEVGYGVFNLIEILKDVRGDLSKADLSRLNLTQVTLNGTDLGERGGGAILTGAKVGHNNLFPVGHSYEVQSAAYSSDGTRIVTASSDNTTKVWDEKTGALLLTLQGHSNWVNSAEYSPDCTRIVTASFDNTAKVWDAKTGALLLTLQGHSNWVNSAEYSPDGTRIVTASWDNTAKVWDAATGALLLTLQGHSETVNYAEYSPDGTRIATASNDDTAKVWDAKTGALLLTLQGHSKYVFSAAFSPDGTRIVTASTDKSAKVWDAATGTFLLTLQGHSDGDTSAAYSPDGARIVTASWDNTAKVWDAATGALLLTLQGHSSCVHSAAYSPDGTRIVTASDDNTAKVWDAVTGALLLTLKGHSNGNTSAAYSPYGTCIVTASLDNTAKVWDAATGALLITLQGHSEAVTSAAYSPDGTRVVTASYDNTAKMWEAATGALLFTLEGHYHWSTSASYSPDGTRIATSSKDETAKVWDAATGALLLTLKGHSKFVASAAYSPDGTRIVTASFDETAKVWDAATGAYLLTLKGHSKFVTSASYSPDGTCIVTASYDNTAKVWDAKTGALLLTLQGHSRAVTSAAYSSNGTRIVTASSDNTTKVWDSATGTLLLTLNGHSSDVTSAAYSPDSTRIVTASYDNTAKVWDAKTGECLDTIPNIPGLMVMGADLRSLHPDSSFSDEDKALLQQYGAIVD